MLSELRSDCGELDQDQQVTLDKAPGMRSYALFFFFFPFYITLLRLTGRGAGQQILSPLKTCQLFSALQYILVSVWERGACPFPAMLQLRSPSHCSLPCAPSAVN